MRKSCRWLLAVLLAPAAGLAAQGVAVEGWERVTIQPPEGAPLAEYQNQGYRMERTAEGIQVHVEALPLHSRSPFRLPSRPPADGVEALGRRITAGAKSQYAAASRVLGWVSRNIAYELDRVLPQDAPAVLERRSGYCTGIARLTVALLTAVGLESREVAGYVVGGEREGGSPAGYHRWVEIRYPDRGWVFSDPLATHHYVPATYLRLAGERVGLPWAGGEGEVLARKGRLSPVDIYPAAAPRVTARRNSPQQLAGALALRVGPEPGVEGLAVLEGGGRRYLHALVDGGATFLGLDPGAYTLRISLGGREPAKRQIDLPGRVRAAVYVALDRPEGDRSPEGR